MEDPKAIVGVALGAASLVLASIGVGTGYARARTRNAVVRGLFLGAMVIALLAGPFLVDWLVLRLNTTTGLSRAFIHVGETALAPSVLGILAFIVTRRLVARPVV